jgi:hypothetical protein
MPRRPGQSPWPGRRRWKRRGENPNRSVVERSIESVVERSEATVNGVERSEATVNGVERSEATVRERCPEARLAPRPKPEKRSGGPEVPSNEV